MPREIDYCGTQIVIDDYEEQHRYENQTNLVEGIPLNPDLRPGFDCTPNDERDPQEIRDWWDKPFIRSCHWDEVSESWEAYLERLHSFDLDPCTREEFEDRQSQQKAGWYESWPSGTRYEVRCLDGGAWDRSTSYGMFATLAEAVSVAKTL